MEVVVLANVDSAGTVVKVDGVVVVVVAVVVVVRIVVVVVVVVFVVLVVVMVVVGVVVVVDAVIFRKLTPSHIIPSGHGAHSDSPGVIGKYHFSPVFASPFPSSTRLVHVQGVSAAFFKLKKSQAALPPWLYWLITT